MNSDTTLLTHELSLYTCDQARYLSRGYIYSAQALLIQDKAPKNETIKNNMMSFETKKHIGYIVVIMQSDYKWMNEILYNAHVSSRSCSDRWTSRVT